AEHGVALLLEREQHAVERHAADEAARAVDRVDDPAPVRPGSHLALLLAHEPVVGEARLDQRAGDALRLAVGDRHGRIVRLRFGRNTRLVAGERDAPGAPRDFDGEVEQVAVCLDRHCRAAIWRFCGGTSRMGTPASASTCLTARTLVVPSWKMPAARAASAPASRKASRMCSARPAPPLAI